MIRAIRPTLVSIPFLVVGFVLEISTRGALRWVGYAVFTVGIGFVMLQFVYAVVTARKR